MQVGDNVRPGCMHSAPCLLAPSATLLPFPPSPPSGTPPTSLSPHLAAMDGVFFPLPVWNSSFDDNDASTTLDTSLETENDSMVRCDGGDSHKVSTSCSSPGVPLGKGLHGMLSYFDDVESFTSKSIRLPYQDVLSPLGHLSQQGFFQQKGSSDTATPFDMEGSKATASKSQDGPVQSGKQSDFALDVTLESDEVVEASISSPAMSVGRQGCSMRANIYTITVSDSPRSGQRILSPSKRLALPHQPRYSLPQSAEQPRVDQRGQSWYFRGRPQ